MRVFLVALLMAACGTSAAEWIRLGESADLTFYADPSSVHRADGTVKMSTLLDHKVPRATARGWIYRSEKMQGEFDCEHGRWRTVYSTFHPGQMGAGPVFGDAYSGTWAQIQSDNVAEATWKFACGKK